MTADEFRAWVRFNQLYPMDDEHIHHRPAAAIAASFGGDSNRYRAVMDFLCPEPVPEGMSAADWVTYKTFMRR
jgi:hypothetical protein